MMAILLKINKPKIKNQKGEQAKVQKPNHNIRWACFVPKAHFIWFFMEIIKSDPPLLRINVAQSFPKPLYFDVKTFCSSSIFVCPSNEKRHPLKRISSPIISANAPMGAVHPPSKTFKNSRSIWVQI